MKTRPQTVPARRPPTPDPRDVVCPHQHFKYDIIDRDILSRKQHLNLLCTPKGYRWVVVKDDPSDLTPDEIASNPCKVVKKKPGKTYVHNILAELWGLLTPEMVNRLKEMLMVEFGLSEEAAVEFICHSRHETLRTALRTKRKREVDEVEDDVAEQDPTLPRLIVEPKLCDKSQFAVGIDPCHIREFSRIVSTKFSEYVVAMMCARRNNRHRRMAEVVLNGLCNLTGENTTLDNPKNRLHKILTLTADRVALWLAQNMDDEDIKRDRRRKKEDEALKKKRSEKQKEQERRRKEKERMNKEIERNNRRKEKEEEEKEKQKQEEQDKKNAEREKRRQEIEKFREEDKKKKQEAKNKPKEDGDNKKQGKKAKGEVKDDHQKPRAKSAQSGGGGPDNARKPGGRGTAKPGGKQGGEGGGRSQQRTAPATKTASGSRSGGTAPSHSSKSPSATPSKTKAGGGVGGGGGGRGRAGGGASVGRTQSGGKKSGDPGESAGAGGGVGEDGGKTNEKTGLPVGENATDGTNLPAEAGAGAPGGESGADQTPTQQTEAGSDDTRTSTEPVPTGASGEGADSGGPPSGTTAPSGAPGEGGATETIQGTPSDGTAPQGDRSLPAAVTAASTDQGEPTPDRPSEKQSDVAPGESRSVAPGTQRAPVSAQEANGGQYGQVEPTEPSHEKSLEERIMSVTTSQIGDTKPVPTPRQETLQDILSKELEKRIEPQDKETAEVIREVASRTATWIDQNVKDAEIEYGSRDKLASRVPPPVSQKPKGPLFVLRKIDPVNQEYEVSTATYTEAGKKIRTLRRNASGRNVTSAPTDPSDPKMWAKWAENASEMADDWGHWIDKTIQDAEDKAVQYQAKAKEGVTQPKDEEDWNRFVETTNEDALTWRRKKKSFDEAAKEWKLYVH